MIYLIPLIAVIALVVGYNLGICVSEWRLKHSYEVMQKQWDFVLASRARLAEKWFKEARKDMVKL